LGSTTTPGALSVHKAHHVGLHEDFFFIADFAIPIPFIGQKMVSRLMPTPESDTGLRNEGMDNLKVLVFAIILQELGYRPEAERPLHTDLIVAVYISLYDSVGSSSK